jgi:hypothetical protein
MKIRDKGGEKDRMDKMAECKGIEFRRQRPPKGDQLTRLG